MLLLRSDVDDPRDHVHDVGGSSGSLNEVDDIVCSIALYGVRHDTPWQTVESKARSNLTASFWIRSGYKLVGSVSSYAMAQALNAVCQNVE